jgi:hypothetical protein
LRRAESDLLKWSLLSFHALACIEGVEGRERIEREREGEQEKERRQTQAHRRNRYKVKD